MTRGNPSRLYVSSLSQSHSLFRAARSRFMLLSMRKILHKAYSMFQKVITLYACVQFTNLYWELFIHRHQPIYLNNFYCTQCLFHTSGKISSFILYRHNFYLNFPINIVIFYCHWVVQLHVSNTCLTICCMRAVDICEDLNVSWRSRSVCLLMFGL